MVEIGGFIQQNAKALNDWGTSVVSFISALNADLLKVPPGLRVKDVSSARAKQLRKNYTDPVQQMTDLVGVRFVVLTSHEVEIINKNLESSELWTCRRVRDPNVERTLDPLVFDYQSHHFEVRPPKGEHSAEPWLCCEVQVRTLLQHAIAELSHDSIYKADIQVPSQAKRLVARSIALMETTDELLCKAMDAVREAASPILALERAARSLAFPLGGSNSDSLVHDLLAAYGSGVTPQAATELLELFGSHGEYSYVSERILARTGQGLFAYPLAALLAYWFALSLEAGIEPDWPFPGSVRDLRTIFSDLGISVA